MRRIQPSWILAGMLVAGNTTLACNERLSGVHSPPSPADGQDEPVEDDGDIVPVRVLYDFTVAQVHAGSEWVEWTAYPREVIRFDEGIAVSFVFGSAGEPPHWPPSFDSGAGWPINGLEHDGWRPSVSVESGRRVVSVSLVAEALSDVVAVGSVMVSHDGGDSDAGDEVTRTMSVTFEARSVGCSLYDDNPDARFGPDSGVLWNDTDWSTPFCRRFVAERDRIEAAIRAREVTAD